MHLVCLTTCVHLGACRAVDQACIEDHTLPVGHCVAAGILEEFNVCIVRVCRKLSGNVL
jgi:hypothetical protein